MAAASAGISSFLRPIDTPDPIIDEATTLQRRLQGYIEVGAYTRAREEAAQLESLLRQIEGSPRLSTEARSMLAEGRVTLAIIANAQRNYSDKLSKIDMAAADELRTRELWLLGWYHLTRGSWEAAISAFRSHLDLGEPKPSSHLGIGICNLKLGRLENALLSLDKAKKLYRSSGDRPLLFQATYALAKAMQATAEGRQSDALDDFGHAAGAYRTMISDEQADVLDELLIAVNGLWKTLTSLKQDERLSLIHISEPTRPY